MRNPNYDSEAFGIQIAVYAEDLSNLDASLSKKSGQLNDTNDGYFPYATDHANEHLEWLAGQLHTLADRLDRLRKYTNYPPLEDK
jgi:hypothetical protein